MRLTKAILVVIGLFSLADSIMFLFGSQITCNVVDSRRDEILLLCKNEVGN